MTFTQSLAFLFGPGDLFPQQHYLILLRVNFPICKMDQSLWWFLKYFEKLGIPLRPFELHQLRLGMPSFFSRELDLLLFLHADEELVEKNLLCASGWIQDQKFPDKSGQPEFRRRNIFYSFRSLRAIWISNIIGNIVDPSRNWPVKASQQCRFWHHSSILSQAIQEHPNAAALDVARTTYWAVTWPVFASCPPVQGRVRILYPEGICLGMDS